MTRIGFIILSLFLFTNPAMAANFLVIEGQIIDSAGVPLESANVDFFFEVRNPGDNCLLYSEEYLANDMTGSNGVFNFKLGQGSSPEGNLIDALNNNLGGPSTCYAPLTTPYTATPGDSRILVITYDAGSGIRTLTQNVELGASAFALSAQNVGGLGAADILHMNTQSTYVLTQANLESVFEGANHTELLALLGGTSTQYLSSAPTAPVNANSQRIENVAVPTGNNDAANKLYVDSNLGQASVSDFSGLTGTENGHVLTWNGATWVNQAPTAVDASKLPLDGSTPMTGDLDMGGQSINNVFDINVSNNIVATGSLSANGVSTSGTLGLYNGANYVALQAPVAAGNYILTMPAASPAASQILVSDAAGNFAWNNLPLGLTPNSVTSAEIIDSSITNADIAASANIDASKLGTGIIDNTELSYLNNLGGPAIGQSGNTLGADMRIGTNDNQQLILRTFGADRLTINTIGYVGIGSTTPTTILDVVGTLKIADGSETCTVVSDGGMIRYNGGNLQFCNGTSWTTLGVSGAGLTSLGGQTGSTQTFAAGSAGNSPAITSGGDTHTLNVPLANAGGSVTSGTISNADYVSFSNKIDSVDGQTLANGSLWIGDGSNQAAAVAISGDATLANDGTLTLAANSVNSAEISPNAVYGVHLQDNSISNQKILGGLDPAKLGSGNVDATELDYLDGVSQPITTTITNLTGQLAGKLDATATTPGVKTIGSTDSNVNVSAVGILELDSTNLLDLRSDQDIRFRYNTDAIGSTDSIEFRHDTDPRFRMHGPNGFASFGDVSGGTSAQLQVRQVAGGLPILRVREFTGQNRIEVNADGEVGIGGNADTGNQDAVTIRNEVGNPDILKVFNNIGTAVLSLTDAGDLGIGNSSPAAPLDVTGSAIINGALNVSGSVTFSSNTQVSARLSADDLVATGTTTCDAPRLGKIRWNNIDKVFEVCDGGNGWVRADDNCPPGYAMVGNPQFKGAFCMNIVNSPGSGGAGTFTYNTALVQCAADFSMAKICSSDQLRQAINDTSGPWAGFTDLGVGAGAVLTRQIASDGGTILVITAANNGIPNGSLNTTTDANAYYCCVD